MSALKKLSPPKCHERIFCVADEAAGLYRCPKGHCGCSPRTHWGGCLVMYVISMSIFFAIYLLKDTLQQIPSHAPGIHDTRYWTQTELKKEVIVSNGMLIFYTSVLTSLLIAIAVIGALSKDIQMLQKEHAGKIPFRGWALGLFNIVSLWDGMVVQSLKYYTGELRPIAIVKCRQVLTKHVSGFNATTDYTASLAQLKSCAMYDSEYFRGFPSGHASAAFAGVFGCGLMFFQIPWLLDGFMNALCGCQNKGSPLSPFPNRVLRSFILMVATVGACFIAASRIMDGSHFPVQTVAGSAIGVCGAVFIVNSDLLLPNQPLGGKPKRSEGEGVEMGQLQSQGEL